MAECNIVHIHDIVWCAFMPRVRYARNRLCTSKPAILLVFALYHLYPSSTSHVRPVEALHCIVFWISVPAADVAGSLLRSVDLGLKGGSVGVDVLQLL